MTIKEAALYLDHKIDESYTPRTLSIRAGTTVHDLKEILTESVTEPNGWVTIPLANPDDAEVTSYDAPLCWRPVSGEG
jgi:anaphase-promoting complex subunit 10